MKNTVNFCKKDIETIKEEFVSCLIDQLCGEEEDDLDALLEKMQFVSLNPVFNKLFSLFVKSISVEDYKSSHYLRLEMIHFVDVDS